MDRDSPPPLSVIQTPGVFQTNFHVPAFCSTCKSLNPDILLVLNSKANVLSCLCLPDPLS